MVKLGLDLRDSSVFVLLSKQKVFHLSNLVISLFELLWGDMFQALKFHLLKIFLTMKTLTRKFLLNLFLKGRGSLRFSQIRSYLVQRVQTDSTTLTDNITSSEIQLICFTIVLNLRDKARDLFLH